MSNIRRISLKNQTIADARVCYMETLQHAKQLTTQARNKWNNVVLEQLENATTFEEVQDAFKGSPTGTSSAELAFKKMLELSVTFEHIRTLELSYDRWNHSAVQRWHQMSLNAINSAESIEAAEDALENLHPHYESNDSSRRCKYLYNRNDGRPEYLTDLRDKAMAKILSFFESKEAYLRFWEERAEMDDKERKEKRMHFRENRKMKKKHKASY